MYKEVIGNLALEFKGGKSKANDIQSPAFRYIHRFLWYRFSDKNKDPTKLTMYKLFFLWCMLHKYKVNFSFWLASQFKTISDTRRGIYFGSVISMLVVGLGLLDTQHADLHIVEHILSLDIHALNTMGLLCLNERKEIVFCPPYPIIPPCLFWIEDKLGPSTSTPLESNDHT